MDHQASTRRIKEISSICSLELQSIKLLVLCCLVALLVIPKLTFADDPTPNPLIQNVTVSASVLQNPGVNPNTPPLPPSSNAGPVNMTDTIDVAIFKGIAYPGSTIALLKNGVVVAQIPANPDGTFDIRVRSLTPGTYSFGVSATDTNALQSKLLMFTIYISQSVATIVEGIFIPPTVTSDKIEVKKGGVITFTGTTAPDVEVRISFSSSNIELLRKTRSDSTGAWFYELDSSLAGSGDFEAKARSVSSQNLSPYSDVLTFRVGDTDRARIKSNLLAGFRKKCDLNNDDRVNLLDFSIMAFWYKRLGFPDKVDLNTDKQINLTDLSILAYCWTG